jgi:hypothetical protein
MRVTVQDNGRLIPAQTPRTTVERACVHSYPPVAFVLAWRVICKGKRWRFLPDVHEQHPVIDRVHKMLESPGFHPLWGTRGTACFIT